MNYKTPGVYIEEIPKLPPSIAQVDTAIPAFIGYTEKAADERTGQVLINEPERISSLLEYERLFGNPFAETGLSVIINENTTPPIVQASIGDASKYKMYYALQMFFANGGGPCWIVSVGDYSTGGVSFVDLQEGLNATEKVDEITLYVYPDAQGLTSSDDFYNLYKASLDMCVELQDRFTVMDIWPDPSEPDLLKHIDTMRSSAVGSEENILKYGATYFPNVETILDYYYGGEGSGDANVTIDSSGPLAGTLAELRSKDNALYFQAQNALRNLPLEMSPSGAVVGQYAAVDSSRGVWKAPANVNMDFVIKPVLKVTDKQQENLNVDTTGGKSVNVIRSFVGRGPAIIWGGRTLAGNSNEWRYVSVRRFFNMVEESVKKASVQFVFEPNDLNTWSRVKSMIDNFLVQQWRAGALMGTTPEQAFFVKVGLNETMDEVDILEGRMIVEIGMAVVRPAEFIILRFSHKMLSE
ncbi:phage tail sheath family protein [Aquimarina sp. AD10]|uniref:Phage tail protein n=1 Tax=Aquimarina aggregata TaxID=1642818 RepID=A0A162WJU7_9FLAO|nr:MULTISPECIES: phage tail sheath C-terminal domain-containing protein [Aquimarina]AXT61560.1 phage tail sheath family protein [Aquimarina sp. AD10]KZS38144.1 phage tail protein [Aquimarina aggregata]RKM90044.1 phage tail sheath family protein [Aquimarina sp. AD10]